MNLGILNETVILIDTDYLNGRISHFLTFYSDLYPDKEFEKINLANLLYRFIVNARIEEAGNNVDILFAYTLGNAILTNCEPNNIFNFIDTNQVQMKTEKGKFLIRSFFADDEESCAEHFIKILRMIKNNPRVSRIILIADNPDLNFELEIMNEQNDLSLFIFKNHHSQTAIDVDVKYMTILYPIAYALGLNSSEI